MTFYFCVSTGMADFLPSTQDYYACQTEAEVLEVVESAKAAFKQSESDAFYASDRQHPAAGHLPHEYVFRMPREGEDNWSQRVMVGRFEDTCLDITGMTFAEFCREQGEMEDREAEA